MDAQLVQHRRGVVRRLGGGSWRLGARRGGVGAVGGFPPSTLGARGGRRQEKGLLGWAGLGELG